MTWDELYRYHQQGSGFATALNGADYYDKTGAYALMDAINAGESQDYLRLQSLLAQGPYGMSPEFTQWLQDMVANVRTNEARNWDEMMRDTSYLSTASQLSQLGLSSSNVVQAGGAVTPSGPVASVSKENVAMERLKLKNSMTQQFIRTAGMLASMGAGAGIQALSRNAASNLSAQTAREALDFRKKESNAKMFMKHKREHYGSDGQLQFTDYWL